jgi:hypothetical protein
VHHANVLAERAILGEGIVHRHFPHLGYHGPGISRASGLDSFQIVQGCIASGRSRQWLTLKCANNQFEATSSGLASLKSLDLLGQMVSQRFNPSDGCCTIFGG